MIEQTLLHRQVHPNLVQNYTVSSQAFMTGQMVVQSVAFKPLESHSYQLSVYNGEKWAPKDAFEHYIASNQSCGVLSVTKEECEILGLLSVEEDNSPFDGHSYIDFSKLQTPKAIKRKATDLRDIAIKRGWQYVPNDEE